ncbi:RNA ligase family protein [Streptomyces sp. NPDC054950]
MEHEFTPWPKTTRLFRDITVTEKLDGTNSAIRISAVPDGTTPVGFMDMLAAYPADSYTAVVDGTRYVLTTQSRKRLIWPGKTTDNYGFASWAYDNAEALVRVLGEGMHFGEWWGRGIQRNYGLDHRRFSLFNTAKYVEQFPVLENGMELNGGHLDVVPVLYQGPFSEHKIMASLLALRDHGSAAVAGFMAPEGICVFHSASRHVTKVTLDNNDAGKWEG